MEEQRFGIGVVEEVDELVLEVAVVHVDRDAAHLERGEQALQVLVAVVEVRRDLGAGLEARRDEGLREPGGAVVELVPRAALLAAHDRDAIGKRVGEPTPRASRSSSPRRSLLGRGVEAGSLAAPIPWAHATARRTAAHSPAAVAPAGPARAVGARRSDRPAPHARRHPRPAGSGPARRGGRPACARKRGRRGAGAAVRGRRRRLGDPHEAARDDAVASRRDRVPGWQARPRARPRPPGDGAAGGAGGDRPRSRTRSRSWRASRGSRPLRRGS